MRQVKKHLEAWWSVVLGCLIGCGGGILLAGYLNAQPLTVNDPVWSSAAPAVAGNDAYVDDWLTRIDDAGGAAPAAGTISAANIFCAYLREKSLDGLMKAVNIIAPDSLEAAKTPLIKTAGVDSWTNHNFVAGDLTVNGLTGNGTSKSFSTWINCIDVFTTNSAGMTVYVSTNQTTTPNCEIGAIESTGASAAYQLITSWGGTTYLDMWKSTGGGRFSTNSLAHGFFSGNRIANNNMVLYHANQGTAYKPIMATVNPDIGAVPNMPIRIFGNNSGTYPGTAGSWSRKTLSFVAIHDGLTAVQSSNLWFAVQTLRTNLGGGYR